MKIRQIMKRSRSDLLRSKAAPRFELGIKDLQSSALPLGHAAIQGASAPLADRISEGSGSLLLISNGHGEDLIALKIIEALRTQRPRLTLKVLPLVGTGGSFRPAVHQQQLAGTGVLQQCRIVLQTQIVLEQVKFAHGLFHENCY